jgi:DNA processing protein
MPSAQSIRPAGYTPEELLGPLNDVERKNAPARIFAAGDVSLLESRARVSVVGSRKASKRGLSDARVITEWLVRHDMIVLSGLAEGIDTAAHEAAIRVGGHTIAVLGTSLAEYFPLSNRGLQETIKREHLALSQFPAGVPSTRGNFPMRNRTMALIADATVIVEASDGSGSLHQAWESLRLGRPLFVMQWLLQDATLSWPKELERYGAQALTLDSLDVLTDFLPERARGKATGLAF